LARTAGHPAISGTDGAVRLALRLQPGARRSAVLGPFGSQLRIAVRAPATDGRANRALLELLAKILDLPVGALQIKLGAGSRDKVVEVAGSRAAVEAALARFLQPESSSPLRPRPRPPILPRRPGRPSPRRGGESMAGTNVLTLTDGNFDAEVLASDRPVLVDFWTTWCGPCRAIAPVIDQLADEYAGRVKIGKVDVDSNRQLAIRYQITSIPTLLVVKGGKVVEQVMGARPKPQIAALLDKHLGH
jgi:thioredoxin 1